MHGRLEGRNRWVLTPSVERVVAIAAVACTLVAVAVALRLRARNRLLCLRVRLVEQRERDAAAAARGLAAASRRSSQSVWRALDRTLRKLDPAIDIVLAFVATGDELQCVFTSGERARHCTSLRLRRDGTALIPCAAARRHRMQLPEADGVLANDRAAVAIPMIANDDLLAIVYVASSRARLDGVEAAVRAIDGAAVPYAIARERERDRTQATYDALTGLLTAAAFRVRLGEAVARAKLDVNARLAVWFIDTDGFKAVNDSFGHAAGDGVLRAVAQLLRDHAVAGLDLVGRNGGDEFCAVLQGAAKTIAIERAEAFCAAVRRQVFELPIAVTASIGVASYPLDAGDMSELLEIADAAMYHSKRCGRNCVAFAIDRGRFAVFK